MGSKILLADDSITIQKVVNLTFSDEGIEVVAVSNGDMAERRLDEVKPDLVLADIFMPGKNGYELCEAIKQNPQFRNVPVVLLVGAFEPFDQAEARRVRADAHLTKPFESRTLVETVRKLINASAHTAGGPIAAMTPADELRDDIGIEGNGRDTDSISSKPTSGRLTSPPTLRLDLSAMMADTSTPSTASARSTGELSSRMGDSYTDAFEVTVAGAAAREAFTATLIDTDEPFETMEFESGEFTSLETSSSLAVDTNEPILDFERSELFESPAHQPRHEQDISFETEPGAVLEVEINRPTIEAQGLDPNRIEITEFDLPSAEAVWNEDAEAAQSNLQETQFEMNVETAFKTPNENAGASLLAAEDPLGNILDETGPIEPPVQDTSSTDSLNLELAEVESAATAPTTHTQFDLIDTPDASPSQASTEAEEQAEDHQPRAASRAADWTSPRAGTYSTAQLDSVVMPIETAAYLAQNSFKESTRSEASQEASFTTPAKWTEEEARFAAIDIEAVPIDEHESQLDSDVPDDAPEYVETPAVSSATEPANGAAATSELSAAAIEEIVRRVIARMSDSVVREVAWEVVPDCVERVVDQLTRESLSKPT
jgi:CheY-like chemotaxis protein